ncbi:hypothetical protein GCM10010428_80420 [Actinosynnema pretiosum subsp. pretiosum]
MGGDVVGGTIRWPPEVEWRRGGARGEPGGAVVEAPSAHPGAYGNEKARGYAERGHIALETRRKSTWRRTTRRIPFVVMRLSVPRVHVVVHRHPHGGTGHGGGLRWGVEGVWRGRRGEGGGEGEGEGVARGWPLVGRVRCSGGGQWGYALCAACR